MNLLIHDLSPAVWAGIRSDYTGWAVVKNNGEIRPCCGCFSCWNKTPGRCVIRDGYDQMGRLIHSADEVTVISRYTYGGFSGFIKNVFDRSLGYVLPQFEVVDGETHHKKRYGEDKPFTFIFYGSRLSPEEKESAERYVKAVCTNIRGFVKEVIFREEEEFISAGGADGSRAVPKEEPASDSSRAVPEKEPAADSPRADLENKPGAAVSDPSSGSVLLLNGSMRYVSGNSQKLAEKLRSQLKRNAGIIALQKDSGEAFERFKDASDVVLCVPLYVDGLPSQVIRFMEAVRDNYQGSPKRIYVLANMGLYESEQLVNLFSTVRQWCRAMSFEYGGGLGVSAGELIGALMPYLPWNRGTTKAVAAGMKQLAASVDAGKAAGDIYAEPHGFPRPLYIAIANVNWIRTSKRNGIRPKDLYRRLKKIERKMA